MIRKYYKNSIVILAIAALFAAAGMILAADRPAFADSVEYVSVDVPLDVYYDDTLLKSYSPGDFQMLGESKTYSYSGFNTYPTAKTVSDASGVRVERLLEDALGGERYSALKADQVIEFTGRDTMTERFTKEQLLSQRYYYPSIEQEQGRSGKAVLPASSAGAVAVPPIISLTEDKDTFKENQDVGRLLFGQISVHDQNHAVFLKYLAPQSIQVRKGREGTLLHSKIIVHSDTADQWNPIASVDPKAGATLEAGTKISLDLSVNAFQKDGNGRYWVYFTMDGSTPTTDSDMYNYNSYGGSQQKYNQPVIEGDEETVLKVIVCGNGKKDSPVSTFRFNTKSQQPVTDPTKPTAAPTKPTVAPTKPAKAPGKAVISKLTLKKKTITVKWKAASRAEGYQIWRAAKKSGKYTLVKTIKSGKGASWKNTGLKKKKTYYYKIRAFRVVSGKRIYGAFSSVKYKKVK